MTATSSQLQRLVPEPADDSTVLLDSPVLDEDEFFSTATTPSAREGNLKVGTRTLGLEAWSWGGSYLETASERPLTTSL